MYKEKYIKYKTKYLELKSQEGGDPNTQDGGYLFWPSKKKKVIAEYIYVTISNFYDTDETNKADIEFDELERKSTGEKRKNINIITHKVAIADAIALKFVNEYYELVHEKDYTLVEMTQEDRLKKILFMMELIDPLTDSNDVKYITNVENQKMSDKDKQYLGYLIVAQKQALYWYNDGVQNKKPEELWDKTWKKRGNVIIKYLDDNLSINIPRKELGSVLTINLD